MSAAVVIYTGCDRHLMGLQILALQRGVQFPELFTDKAYTLRCVSISVFFNNNNNNNNNDNDNDNNVDSFWRPGNEVPGLKNNNNTIYIAPVKSEDTEALKYICDWLENKHILQY